MRKKDILKIVFSVKDKLYQRAIQLEGDIQDDILNIARMFDNTIQDLISVNNYGSLYKDATPGQQLFVINYIEHLKNNGKE